MFCWGFFIRFYLMSFQLHLLRVEMLLILQVYLLCEPTYFFQICIFIFFLLREPKTNIDGSSSKGTCESAGAAGLSSDSGDVVASASIVALTL